MKHAIRRGVVACIAAAVVAGCATEHAAPLPTVEAVDLSRYVGTWYEIALVPNRFQAVCAADTQARYRMDGDVLRVTNRCRRADGGVEEANGVAKVVEGSGNAKLRVSFFRPFYGNYWVLALGPDYGWALVGEPGRAYGWVLSRTPVLDDAALGVALDRAAALGYDRTAFRRTPQGQPLD
ncbi:MAG: lipocalin family protein [Gammaproteobacteria bacterium]|jgi:apolipoprotein D and lipocalin family protein|nr:lipocalin family protein [Gammaproteobacteria bacterium]